MEPAQRGEILYTNRQTRMVISTPCPISLCLCTSSTQTNINTQHCVCGTLECQCSKECCPIWFGYSPYSSALFFCLSLHLAVFPFGSAGGFDPGQTVRQTCRKSWNSAGHNASVLANSRVCQSGIMLEMLPLESRLVAPHYIIYLRFGMNG